MCAERRVVDLDVTQSAEDNSSDKEGSIYEMQSRGVCTGPLRELSVLLRSVFKFSFYKNKYFYLLLLELHIYSLDGGKEMSLSL